LTTIRLGFIAAMMVVAILVLAACESGEDQDEYGYLGTQALEQVTVKLGGLGPVKPTGDVKEFELAAKQVEWELLPGVRTMADTFNGTVPGPTIRVTEGDTVRVTLKNDLPQETSIHWHGLHIRNDMDGVAGVTQKPIMPGQTFTYEFIASHAGTFMYHSHSRYSREQIDRGLYGLLIIDPQRAESPRFEREYTLAIQGWQVGMEEMQAMGMDYNYFTLNGKSFPATEPLMVEEGDVVRVRLINPSQTIHPMHLHGQDFKVVARDGEPLKEPWIGNTLDVQQGETYDIVFVANNPGVWAFHCHDLHHTANDGVEPGGLMVLVQYEGYEPVGETGQEPMPAEMPGMEH